MLEAILDGFFGHRLQPQTLHRHFGLGVLGDVIKDELAFASRIAGVDEAINILAAQQFLQHFQARCRFLNGLQIKMWRNHRQMRKGPLAALDFKFFGADQRQEVTHGRGKDVIVAFVIVIMLGKATQRFGNIQRNGRFFGND